MQQTQYNMEGDTMLVLSRGRNEDIHIGDNIVVKVLEINENEVRLGFDAPPDIPIHRKEVYDSIHNKQSE